jgi:hypothetical protein
MHLKSILNRGEPLKSYVSKEWSLVEVAGGQTYLDVHIELRANGPPICSGCGDWKAFCGLLPKLTRPQKGRSSHSSPL